MSTEPIADNSRPLRILHYVPAIWLKQGGVVRAILDWCEVFSRRGHLVRLVVYHGDDIPADWLNETPGKPHAYIVDKPHPPLKQLNAAAMKLLDDLLGDTDIVHLHAPWLDGNWQLAKLCQRRGRPYVVSLHGMIDDWSMTQSPLKKRLYMRLCGTQTLDRAARLHCTAAAEWDQARKWTSNSNVTVLPYLVDMAPYRDLPGPEAGLLKVTVITGTTPPVDVAKLLFLSRLSEQKGIDLLIDAAALLRDRQVKFVLWIAGTGEEKYERLLRDQVERLQLNDRVRFLGLITGAAKLSLYQAADLFIHPTRQENFGLVITEAMACGAAVLTTPHTDIWREVQTGGAVICPARADSLADGIEQLLGNRPHLKDRGQSSRQWVLNWLAEEPLARQFEAMYRQCIRTQL